MAAESELGRRERILDAAEHAFADFGFEGASLRHIVLDAGVNLATVYYYFNSKEGLLAAALKRRFDPLKQQHLELLAQARQKAQGRPLPVEQIFNAMMAPTLSLKKKAAHESPVLRLIGRMMAEPNNQIQAMLRYEYDDVRSAFLEELRRSLPGLPLIDLHWRIAFAWGALSSALCNARNVKEDTKGICDPDNAEQLLAQLTSFLAAGFRAPATS
jgi:AcrR family transcriptional regulator